MIKTYTIGRERQAQKMQTDDIPYKDYDHADKMRRGYAFTIDRDGRWYCHDPNMGEGPIKRDALAKLFAGAGSGFMAGKGLSVDQAGRYWLKSPQDVYEIEVEDVPFVISDFETVDGTIKLKTNFGEIVPLDTAHTFELHKGGPFPDVPYVTVRTGLKARVSRAVLYNLVPMADEQDNQLLLHSGGKLHRLGAIS